MIILIQKFRSTPLFLRTIATHLIVFNVGNRQEEDALEEEFGAKVPHLKEKLYACTQAIEGVQDRGFMLVDLRKYDTVYRNFEARLELDRESTPTEQASACIPNPGMKKERGPRKIRVPKNHKRN